MTLEPGHVLRNGIVADDPIWCLFVVVMLLRGGCKSLCGGCDSLCGVCELVMRL